MTPLLALIPWGQIFGLGGTVISYFQKKQQNAHELALRKQDMELLIAQGNVNQAALAGELAKIRQQGADAAFTKSYEDSAATRGGKKTNAFRNFTRPGLTWWFVVAFYSCTVCVIRGVGAQYFDHPLAAHCFVVTSNLMEMCVTWWFGQRQADKMTTEWGNKMVGAKISGSATQAPTLLK